jgi:hypothetical protein
MVATAPGSFKKSSFFSDQSPVSGAVILRLNPDRYYEAKRYLGADAPEYYATITRIDSDSYEYIQDYFVPSFFSSLGELDADR